MHAVGVGRGWLRSRSQAGTTDIAQAQDGTADEDGSNDTETCDYSKPWLGTEKMDMGGGE